ncbi:MAG: ATP-binding cassette domain-containing protein [Monoglobales bacterium]
MRDGKWVATEKAENITTDRMIKLMVGRDLTSRFPPKTNKTSDIILEVKNLSGMYPPTIKNVSFELKKGEILGIAGLVGSRRSELLETIFGIARKKSGEIFLNSERKDNKNPRQAIKNGFALITEERRATGIFEKLSVELNAVIANIKKYSTFGVLSERKIKGATRWVIDSMRVKTPSERVQIKTLSGGNQQKVIIGRWLLTEPEILLLDEPTRGIDVGAKYEIYQLIIDLAKKNKGVIVVSSEMPELLGICDRILVMSNGRVAGIRDVENITQEEIVELSAKYL